MKSTGTERFALGSGIRYIIQMPRVVVHIEAPVALLFVCFGRQTVACVDVILNQRYASRAVLLPLLPP